jgi:hypothetical protein
VTRRRQARSRRKPYKPKYLRPVGGVVPGALGEALRGALSAQERELLLGEADPDADRLSS